MEQPYVSPATQYFQTKAEFDEAVGLDFINASNKGTQRGKEFIVGLSHGQSPSGAYQYIIDHFSQIKRPASLFFTFVNSPLKRQRGLEDVMHAQEFIEQLLGKKLISKKQVCCIEVDRSDLHQYVHNFTRSLSKILDTQKKTGLDYVFLASDPKGQVAGITRNSSAFGSEDIAVVVKERGIEEFTLTPHFLSNSGRIAFLATKADKRRALAWLFIKGGRDRESPAFLRHIDNVADRMTVFIDDEALTWPQVEIIRESRHGGSTIRIDVANPYRENAKNKLPVILLIHGFLGLNSYDGLLTAIPSHKYIAAAMHYGSVPDGLPPERYSRQVVKNIDAVIQYFGSKGHDVYLFDHSIANIYFLMINRDFDSLPGIRKHLKGRIGANPFFGKECKHATIGFLDNVLIPAVKTSNDTVGWAMFETARKIVPFDSKKGVRKRGMKLAQWLIGKETPFRNRIWKEAKDSLLNLMSNLGSLPPLNRIPIERALNRLPVKLFALQVHSALQESKSFDWQKGVPNFEKRRIPILILKSERDPIAKFASKVYDSDVVQVIDVTNAEAKDLFQEHLYHMVHPRRTAKIIDDFISEPYKTFKDI